MISLPVPSPPARLVSSFRHRSTRIMALGVFVAVLAPAMSIASSGSGAAFAAAVEKAHGGDAWNARTAFAADIVVNFGGSTVIDGKMMTDTPVGKTRFELEDGTVLVFDGQDAWTSPADSKFRGTRFHVLTWPYFLAAAMKLDDPGAHLEPMGPQPFEDGEKLDAARLTFGENVGDSPDDWYVVYRDRSNQLAGMAYIVTFGKSTDEAEKEPHAITYHDYVQVDGVAIPTRWKFWNWSAEKGIFGDPIGDVALDDPGFVSYDSADFVEPSNARREAAPES